MFWILVIILFVITGPLLICCIQDSIDYERNKEIEKYNRDDY